LTGLTVEKLLVSYDPSEEEESLPITYITFFHYGSSGILPFSPF
jgi:hypothetical protein